MTQRRGPGRPPAHATRLERRVCTSGSRSLSACAQPRSSSHKRGCSRWLSRWLVRRRRRRRRRPFTAGRAAGRGGASRDCCLVLGGVGEPRGRARSSPASESLSGREARRRCAGRSQRSRRASAYARYPWGRRWADGYFSRYLPQLVLAVIVPLAVAWCAAADWISALIVVVTLPAHPGVHGAHRSGARAATRPSAAHAQGLSGHFLDAVRGLPTLKVFGRSKAQVETIER